MDTTVQTDGERTGRLETVSYDNNIVRLFAIASAAWGLVGFLVGVLVAIKFYWPGFLGGIDYLSFGRLRPLHTNAVIFAFAGNAIFLGVYYSLQRLCKTRMFSDVLSKVHFWGWQFIIVAAALTLPLGITTSKEYAELEWPIDIAITLVWVVFGWNMIGTILRRKERHMYVAIWFYLATFLTVALLHIVNSLALPVHFLKSYSMYAGVQDALVQWWYGHNAVAFFLTTPFLGIMYYFVSTLDHSLLGADLLVHLGRSAPLVVYGAAGLGAIARRCLQLHAHCSELGWHGKRTSHTSWSMG
jgi:cytochrome c oxidase cbb3-type subunit I/II